MLVKWGGGIVDGRGSMAGNTFARNHYGNYSRARTKPVNPKSARQVAIRTIMMFIAEQWRESPMTGAIRTAWETYAASYNWVNKLGEQISLTGFNSFVQCNNARIAAGKSLVTAGPVSLGLPAGDPAFAVTISEATNKISFAFDDGFDWVDEDEGAIAIYMGQPVSASRNYFGGPFRLAGSISGDAITPPTTPDATLDCPFTAIEGQQTFLEARIIREDGRVSTRFRAAPVIIAA